MFLCIFRTVFCLLYNTKVDAVFMWRLQTSETGFANVRVPTFETQMSLPSIQPQSYQYLKGDSKLIHIHTSTMLFDHLIHVVY